jgi:hypothetical protein
MPSTTITTTAPQAQRIAAALGGRYTLRGGDQGVAHRPTAQPHAGLGARASHEGHSAITARSHVTGQDDAKRVMPESNVDSKFVMDELAAQRNKHADDAALARAFASQLQQRCVELESENAELRERLAALATPSSSE